MEYDNILLNFTSIIFEALPFVVLGVIIAGILEEFVPQQFISGLFHQPADGSRASGFLRPVTSLLRFRAGAIALGGLLGLVFPMCECGIIAVMRRLIRKGVPLSVCVCYMLAGPIINVVVLMSTYVAFAPPDTRDYLFPVEVGDTVYGGPWAMVLLRAGLAFVVAFVAASIVDARYRREGDSLLHPALVVATAGVAPEDGAVRRTFLKRLGSISETALHDFIDIMAFLVLGAALAAVGKESIEGSQIQETIGAYPALAILAMMGIAILFSLCSEADAFVAANFSMLLPPAAKLAFLVAGPMFDIKLYMMYTRIFRQRLIWTIVLSVLLQVFVYSMLVHYLWPGQGFSEYYYQSVRSSQSP